VLGRAGAVDPLSDEEKDITESKLPMDDVQDASRESGEVEADEESLCWQL